LTDIFTLIFKLLLIGVLALVSACLALMGAALFGLLLGLAMKIPELPSDFVQYLKKKWREKN
jgi:hypothetical protein